MRACSGYGSQGDTRTRGGFRRKKTTLESVALVTLRDSHYSEPSERAAGADRRAIRVPGEDPGVKKTTLESVALVTLPGFEPG